MKAYLDHIESLHETVLTFWLRPERPLRYMAGQYLELFLPHRNADDRGERRWFSLSSSPSEPLLGITARFEPTGGSSLKQTLRNLQPGAEISVSDPLGDFVLPKDPSIPLVFVAAGIGITPVRSMLQWLADKHEKRPMQLIYIAQTPADILFSSLLQSYNGLRFSTFYTHSSAQTRFTAKDVLEHMSTIDGKLVYLSGPQPLIEHLWEGLQAHGIAREQLVLDYFPGYTEI